MASDPRTALMLQLMQNSQQQRPMRRGEGLSRGMEGLANAFMAKKVMSDIESRPEAAAGNTPSAIREYEYFSKLSPEQQKLYLQAKRQTVSPGMFVEPTGGVVPMPGYQDTKANFARTTEAAKVSGKEMGEKEASLRTNEAKLPQLEETVNKLSELGKKATYTKAGQGVDIANRELGLQPRDEAIARAEYIALVDNQVLPLLRDTFGAQFTQKEGESLKVTLGDPNKTPAEKDAVLRSFIQQKKANINSLKRELTPPSPDVMMRAIKNTPAGDELVDDGTMLPPVTPKAMGADVLGRGQEGVTKSGIKYRIVQ